MLAVTTGANMKVAVTTPADTTVAVTMVKTGLMRRREARIRSSPAAVFQPGSAIHRHGPETSRTPDWSSNEDDPAESSLC